MTDELVTDSGGIAHRLTEPPREVTVDLSSLESERRSAYDVPARPLGVAPYLQPGQVVTWHYGLSVDVLRVVRDDARGIVAWLPSESEQLASLPVDGLGVRDRPLAQRFTAPREMRVRTWWGPGILRIAPAGRPWSIWYFRDEQGRFQGHYVNLELVHERPVDGSPRV